MSHRPTQQLFVLLSILFISLGMASSASACGPQEQAWTWAGVNQYQPNQCTCEELRTALSEEQVIYLGNYWKGLYVFSSPAECRASFSHRARRGKIQDKEGRPCRLGFSCLGKQTAHLQPKTKLSTK